MGRPRHRELQRTQFGFLSTGVTIAARPGWVEVIGGSLSIRLPTGGLGVALSWHAPAGHRGGESQGSAQLEEALPSSLTSVQSTRGGRVVGSVIIGMDPHK